MELILGTVQLGMPYGIHNQTGMPDREEAFDILNSAGLGGVSKLDTAKAYREAETVIGAYHQMQEFRFDVSTKINMDVGEILHLAANSCGTMHINSLDILYLHQFMDCKKTGVLEILQKCKSEGFCRRLGVSIYAPDDLEWLFVNAYGAIDVIQFPLNLLDGRWRSGNLLEKAASRGFTLYARSIFLQGLIFKEPNSKAAVELGAQNILENLQNFCKEKEITVAECAISYMKHQLSVQGLLLGCETKNQLCELLALWLKPPSLNHEDVVFIEKNIQTLDQNILEPRRWKL